MAKRWLVLMSVLVLTVGACAGGGGSPSPGAGSPAGSPAGPPDETAAASPEMSPEDSPAMSPEGSPAMSPEGSPAGSPAGSPTAVDCGTGSGELSLAGFSAGGVEEGILRGVLDSFEAACPNYTVTFEVIAGEYQNVMLPRLGTGDAPDLFYVQQGYAQDWIDQELLQSLDENITATGFDMTHFFPGYLAPFQQDGETFGLPKDSSILAMETNDTMLADAGVTIPTTVEELEAAAQTLKTSGVETPMCFAAEYARAGAFLESFGGGMLNEERTEQAIDTPESRAALDWYIKMYADGLAQTPPQMGVDWCGQALGEERVAFAFEGNWIGPAMTTTYPEIAYTVSAIPQATEPATLSFTAAYAYSPDSPNPDGSWALLTFLTSQQGQQEWVDGGLVLPSRDDVTVTEPTLAQFAPFGEAAHPGEGLLPGWSAIQDAFNGALANAADGSATTDDVVSATLPAVETALGQ